MRTWIIGLVAVAALLAACGSGSGNTNDKSSNDQNAPAANSTSVARPDISGQSTQPVAQPTQPAAAAPTSSQPAATDGNAPGIPTVTGDVQTTADGLKYIDITVGNGQQAKPTDTVTVNYTGWLTDGTKFDASADHGGPATFPLSGVIPGWTEGVGSMKVGGKRRLIVPAPLGYGAGGSPPVIPPNATLIFDVELLAIQ
ncbi:MAG TPA: FKBP-type peptidyl-prolyl cis-trans isomerase [Dehalococcoidia bacterium]|nr:FKBP-type peptidyl-prolyl cis-trans isomerase [Dehalococcoidia bacterium]